MLATPAAEDVVVRCVVYTSRTRQGWTADDLAAAAAGRNGVLGVAGRLLYLDRRFIQVLEGHEAAVGGLMRSISADQRHFDLRVLIDTAVVARSFSGWAMDSAQMDEAMESVFAREIDTLSADAMAAFIATEAGPGRLSLLGGIAASFVNRTLRVTPRQQRAQETTEQLLVAAQRVAVRDGVAAATMQAVAESAGIGLKTAYRYFSSPGDMFRLLVRQRQSRMFAGFRSWLGEVQFSTAGDLARQIVIYSVGSYMSDPRMPEALNRVILRDYHDIAFQEMRELAGDVVAAMARGGLEVDDPGLRGGIALALAGLGGAAKMAGLHDPAQMRGGVFVEMMGGMLEAAMLGGRGAAFS